MNVTAVLDTVSVSKYASIEIEPESHHVPVQFVQVIAFPSTEKMAVDLELAVYGGPVITCKVGDGGQWVVVCSVWGCWGFCGSSRLWRTRHYLQGR